MSFEIVPGTAMILDFISRNDRLRCDYLGMSPNDFIIVRVPLMAGMKGICREGNTITFRYIYDGRIYGFRSSIQHYTPTPYSLLFCNYPHRVEKHDLRRHQRISCHFPAEITVAGTMLKGMITDISSGGCKFSCEICHRRFLKELGPDALVQGAFYVLDREQDYPFIAQPVSFALENGLPQLGLKFDEEQTEIPDKIKSYVKEVSRLLEL